MTDKNKGEEIPQEVKSKIDEYVNKIVPLEIFAKILIRNAAEYGYSLQSEGMKENRTKGFDDWYVKELEKLRDDLLEQVKNQRETIELQHDAIKTSLAQLKQIREHR